MKYTILVEGLKVFLIYSQFLISISRLGGGQPGLHDFNFNYYLRYAIVEKKKFKIAKRWQISPAPMFSMGLVSGNSQYCFSYH